ncbi:carbohydrate phosphatase [Sporormia fimetaria CBS 119925]|uniref:Carbohydrate phosphatase n=1 Tax=Sporormia fimetaria CBS 119925 TaxID=1340428 RepID=A0A6A6UVZ8_9PLEO|nr:carbohydrate phosphatase [Sporormia fimetaria CBS 119925]
MSTTPSYADELTLALRAVHAASILTKDVLRSLSNSVSHESHAKNEPVTIADFAAQALLTSALHAVYPSDRFVGEESASALRSDDGLAERVWELVQRAGAALRAVSGAMQETRPLSVPSSKEKMLSCIDAGAGDQSTAEGRIWVMDPVDGTLSFMHNRQYAVCLCLLVDGVQTVGVIGAPNLKIDTQGKLGDRIHEDLVDEDGYGVLLSAVRGKGTYVRSMHADSLGPPRHISPSQHTTRSKTNLDFVETTVGKTSLCQDDHKAVADLLGSPWPGTVLWSQQAKYVALTLGTTDVMLRIPKDTERFTHIWDHAGGQLLFQETGGIIKDFDGKDIDFRHGRKIVGTRNFGMLAARPDVFDDVMEAVKRVLGRRTA